MPFILEKITYTEFQSSTLICVSTNILKEICKPYASVNLLHEKYEIKSKDEFEEFGSTH